MLSIARGHDTGYLTGTVAAGREGYYTSAVAAGEPAGQWAGAGAQALGLAGLVDEQVMADVYSRLRHPQDPESTIGAPHRTFRPPEEIYADLWAAEPHASPERRAVLRAEAEDRAKQPVLFYDATFSAPKSVTLLGVAAERAENEARVAGRYEEAAAWGAHRRAVEDAVMAGATAAMEYLQDQAGYGRVGHHGPGGGRWIDSHQWVVAQFLQHDSRDRDPQLHVHQAILNRQLCADGVWRGINRRELNNHRGGAGAVGERVMEAHLARTLGLQFVTRADGHGREVADVPHELMELFSTRARVLTGRAAQMVEEFTRTRGREPSPLERKWIRQRATLATRAAKSHDGETNADRLDRWEGEARAAMVGGLGDLARTVLTNREGGGVEGWEPRAVIDRALADVGHTRTTWTRADLLWSLSDALPANLAIHPTRVRALLESLADEAIAQAARISPEQHVPRELRLADGRSSYEAPSGARWSSPGQLAADRRRREAAVTRVEARCTADDAAAAVARVEEAGVRLGADQAAALVGIVSSGAQVQVLSAPAGSGKSFVVGQAAAAWVHAGGRVLGLAPSQIAAQVLAEEGVPALNLAAWRGQVERGQAPAADLLVLDEAGMARTDDVDAVVQYAERTGATVVLVGDDRQLAAVGPGGALADLAERALTHQLVEVRRFTAAWEKSASLRLRDGDRSVLADYDQHGRIVDGGTPEEAERKAGRAWLADTLAGRDSVLVVGSNDAAARLSGQLREQLVQLGRVAEAGVELGRDGNMAGAGDVVQARRNDWTLDAAPVNRATYRVTQVLDDGSLRVQPTAGGQEQVLPAAYVRQDLTLAYASTVHAAQGRTVDTAHAVLGPGQDAAAAYVALTRGRDRNTAHVVTREYGKDAHPGQALDVELSAGRAVLEGILDRAEVQRTALAQQELAEAVEASFATQLERLAAQAAVETAGRTGRILDELTAEGALTQAQRESLAADRSTGALDRLLRTAEVAGHDPAEVLRGAVTAQTLENAQSIAQVLHYRIRSSGRDLAPRLATAEDLVPRDVGGDIGAWMRDVARGLDERRHELGAQAADEAPAWALDALGPVPTNPMERAEWEARAGWAAAYRETAELDEDGPVLGVAPPGGLTEKHAVWRTAHAELDMPEAGAEEALLSGGALRNRVAAAEREEAWAPRWVGDELAATELQLAERRADAELWSARADAGDPDADELRAAAVRASIEAVELADRVAELAVVDEARGRWLVETAVTRDLAERARTELESRGVDLDADEGRVTAEEWLAAHCEDQAVEDEHRAISELDVLEPTSTNATSDEAAETAVPDIRETAVPDPTERQDGGRRVPTLAETAAAVERARDALAELEQRETLTEDERRWEPAVQVSDDDAMVREL